jgi:transcriptional regulator with XRE-family HTH domain
MLDTKEIIERVKEVLEVSTQNEIAIYFEVSTKSVSEWKNGNTALPYQRLMQMAREKGINLNWLFYGKGRKLCVESNDQSDIKNGVLNKQIGDNNSFYIKVDANISTNSKKELEHLATLFKYAPPAYLDQVHAKLEEFKAQIEG